MSLCPDSSPATAEGGRKLSRDGRPIHPYRLKKHQIKEHPLTCLWWELRYHGFQPLEALEGQVMAAMRESKVAAKRESEAGDFWDIRAKLQELAGFPAPVIE